jgi:branched-chain amino acid transport system ATP-binding protein
VILGPNGAGKTTLLKALAGLIPKAGLVTLNGEQLPDATHRLVRAGVALVAEGRQLFGQMTVSENLELGGWIASKAERAQRIEQAFRLFPKLRERAQQLAGTMSGGEQQMVAVARALVGAPRLLLLDEPSLGLAPKMVDELLAAARRIADGGTTVLMVEQNVRKALAVADRGYVMERGALVASGKRAAAGALGVVRQATSARPKPPASAADAASGAVSPPRLESATHGRREQQRRRRQVGTGRQSQVRSGATERHGRDRRLRRLRAAGSCVTVWTAALHAPLRRAARTASAMRGSDAAGAAHRCAHDGHAVVRPGLRAVLVQPGAVVLVVRQRPQRQHEHDDAGDQRGVACVHVGGEADDPRRCQQPQADQRLGPFFPGARHQHRAQRHRQQHRTRQHRIDQRRHLAGVAQHPG